VIIYNGIKARKRVLRQMEWHQWFAWYPVWVGPNFVWLETIDRRRSTWESGWIWHYAPAGVKRKV
jgi:hypothetical protein